MNTDRAAYRYDYGVLGYVLRYCGGLTGGFICLTAVFLLYLGIPSGLYTSSPLSGLLLFTFCLLVLICTGRATYYMVKHAAGFTAVFTFTRETLEIDSAEGRTLSLTWSSLSSIRFYPLLKLYVLAFSPDEEVVLMNNWQLEDHAFERLGTILMQKPVPISRRWL